MPSPDSSTPLPNDLESESAAPPALRTPAPPPSPPTEPDAGFWSELARAPRYVKEPFGLGAMGIVLALPALAVSPLLSGVLGLASLGLGGFTVVRWTTITTSDSPPPTDGNWEPVATADLPQAPLSIAPASALADLEQCYFRHLYFWDGEAKVFGMRRQFSASYFLDLMEASLVAEDRATMADALVQLISQHADRDSYDIVLGPKRGNALLMVAVGERLAADVVFVKERPLFGRRVEGLHKAGPRALLVDDISSDGEFLADCVASARETGITIDRAFTLVDRTEGDARDQLQAVGVELVSQRRLGDGDLAEIATKGRRG